MDLKGVAMVKTPIVEEEKKLEHAAERAGNPHREESRRGFWFLFAENEISQRLQNAKTQPELWRLLADLHRRLDANHGVTGSW